MAGTVVGQPLRKRLKVDDDPFGAVGDYAGGFLIKSAVELSGGYDTNPGRLPEPKGLPFWVVAPEFLAVSDWERHALVADLRGSYTGYGGNLPADRRWGGFAGADQHRPAEFQRPYRWPPRCHRRHPPDRGGAAAGGNRQSRQPEHPGRPCQISGLYHARRHLRRRPESSIGWSFAAGATVDRTVYQDSNLTDGTTSTNDDRNFNQYGGVGRLSYELTPAVKPFVEVEGDSRVHDLPLDRNGYARDSTGGYAKGGTTFEFSRLLTGEVSIGYAARDYVDPRLARLDGLLTAGSLVWTATPLTTARFYLHHLDR